MTDRLRTIQHAGREVVVSDFSQLKDEDELLACMEQAMERDRGVPDGSLLLTDITGCYISPPVRDRAMEMGKMADRRGFRQAIVGVTGIQKVIFMLVKRSVHLAKDQDDALAWLARQA